jgi:hypothetical protein
MKPYRFAANIVGWTILCVVGATPLSAQFDYPTRPVQLIVLTDRAGWPMSVCVFLPTP